MNNPNYYFAVRWLEAQGVSENEWGYLCDKIREAINIDEFTKEELDCLHRIFVSYFEDSLGKNVSGEYTDEVILMDKIGERLGI